MTSLAKEKASFWPAQEPHRSLSAFGRDTVSRNHAPTPHPRPGLHIGAGKRCDQAAKGGVSGAELHGILTDLEGVVLVRGRRFTLNCHSPSLAGRIPDRFSANAFEKIDGWYAQCRGDVEEPLMQYSPAAVLDIHQHVAGYPR